MYMYSSRNNRDDKHNLGIVNESMRDVLCEQVGDVGDGWTQLMVADSNFRYQGILINEYNPDVGDIVKQLKSGPELRIREKLKNLNDYYIDTTGVWGNRSSLIPLPRLEITDKCKWKRGYKKIIKETIEDRFLQYHKPTGSGGLALMLKRRPRNVKRAREEFIDGVVFIDEQLHKLRTMDQTLGDIDIGVEGNLKWISDNLKAKFKEFTDWEKKFNSGIICDLWIEEPVKKYKEANNQKILSTEIVLDIVIPKPTLEVTSQTNDGEGIEHMFNIPYNPIHLQFRCNLLVYLQMLHSYKNEYPNLDSYSERTHLPREVLRDYKEQYYKVKVLLDSINYTHYTEKDGGVYCMGYMKGQTGSGGYRNSTPIESHRDFLYPFINSGQKVVKVDHHKHINNNERSRNRNISHTYANSYNHKFYEVCLGDLHHSALGLFLGFNFKVLVLKILNDWNSYVYGKTHPLNNLGSTMILGVPKKWGSNASDKLQINHESCGHRLWTHYLHNGLPHSKKKHEWARLLQPSNSSNIFSSDNREEYIHELESVGGLYGVGTIEEKIESSYLGKKTVLEHCNKIECQERLDCKVYRAWNCSVEYVEEGTLLSMLEMKIKIENKLEPNSFKEEIHDVQCSESDCSWHITIDHTDYRLYQHSLHRFICHDCNISDFDFSELEDEIYQEDIENEERADRMYEAERDFRRWSLNQRDVLDSFHTVVSTDTED